MGKVVKLRAVIKGCLEFMPSWKSYDDAYLVRGVGPFLQLILFSQSRWSPTAHIVLGFEFLGMQLNNFGVLAGDTIKGSKGSVLTLPLDTPPEQVVSLFEQHVRPSLKDKLTLDSAYSSFKQRVEIARNWNNNVALFRASLYMNDRPTAISALELMRSLGRLTAAEIENNKQLCSASQDELKKAIDQSVQENVRKFQVPDT